MLRKWINGSHILVLAVCLLLCVGNVGANEKIHNIKIPKQNAVKALEELALQTNSITLFPYDLASTIMTNPVDGQYTLLQALNLLLQDTGLDGGISDKRVISIKPLEKTELNNIDKPNHKDSALATNSATMLTASPTAHENQSDTDTQSATDVEERIMVLGSRRTARSISDSIAPVDIISAAEFTRNSSSDALDLLRTSVPAFNVAQEPITDASTISRPANLRGLSPDNTLVLVNGKRRHRGAIISFLGRGISDGAQGVDLSSIPSAALKQVEVLRDGASSQYGSDAIAGVINFSLKDVPKGGFLQVSTGSTFEGDGDRYSIAGNIGLPLGDSGFVNLTAEYGESDATNRSQTRPDVAALIAAGNTAAADSFAINQRFDDFAQYWGQPDVEGDLKLFFNAGIDINDNAEIYSFGSYAERHVEGGFFYRNPTNRGGIYGGPTVDANGVADPTGGASILVGDLDGLGMGGSCVAGIPLTGQSGLVPDPTVLAQVTSDANCFSFYETIPGGFNPRFGGDVEDTAIAIGIRGEFDNGLTYDLSANFGESLIMVFINNTLNPSLGPDSPRDFTAGGQKQEETTFNADFSYAVDVGLYSDLNIGFGAEYRDETYSLIAGDAQATEIGSLVSQGFSSGANGYGSFASNTSASQDNTGFYVDLEADITEAFTLQGALRYEDFSSFGSTTNFKLGGLYRVSDGFSIRSTYSTGFHAPSAGQATITNISTTIQNGVLVADATLPFDSAAGTLGADFIASQGNGRPTLGPEEAENFSIGVAFEVAGSSWTIDFYNIDLEDRVTVGNTVNFLDALNFAGGGSSFTSVNEALTGLDSSGVLDRADFAGLDDLQGFRFFSNSFDTNTKGLDIIGRKSVDIGGGVSDFFVLLNYNDTEVTNIGSVNPIGQGRVGALEDQLPNWKGNISWTHTQGSIRTLVRANYFGEWDATGQTVLDNPAEFLVDVDIAYEVREGLEIVAGANNIFDVTPPIEPGACCGNIYLPDGPYGFNGAEYYLKARLAF
jgi:iron complex outermembrane receptor protein